MKEELKAEILSWIKTIVCAIVFAFCINSFVIVNASIPTGSMRDTIMEGDRVVAFRLSYLFAEPERFDVIVFKYPDDESVLYVKRLIALPGETVQVIDGKVLVDGNPLPLDDPFAKEATYEPFGPYVVPEDSYFMMGDNRNNSHDSRYWINTLKKDSMLGKVIFRYYPNIGIIE